MFGRWTERSFAKDIETAAPFLSVEYGAALTKSHPKARSPRFECKLRLSRNLIFEFSKWRDENYWVRVSPTFAPRDSYDLLDVLGAASTEPASIPSYIMSWSQFAKRVEPKLMAIENTFSEENFAATKARLANLQTGAK
jgi:hypothetical protein